MRHGWRALWLLAALGAAGCDDGEENDTAPDAAPDQGVEIDDGIEADQGPEADQGAGDPEPIDIVGDYTDDFATPHRVTAAAWSQGPADSVSLTTFTHVDNTARLAVGQNAPDHPFAADAWSRFDYTFAADRLWYCQTAFDAPDEATALAATAPDAADPAAGGCGGFPWSALTPAAPPPHLGAWIDDFDTPYAITPALITLGADDMASRFVLTETGPAHAIARNADDNPFSPGAWSRFDFTTAAGVVYICQSAYDAPDAATARAASADAADPATGGCSMFPWSALRPAE